jgi:Phospholipase A2-like domain
MTKKHTRHASKKGKKRAKIRKNSNKSRKVRGKGFFNSFLNKLPFELHMPGGYNYCGPGTRLTERLSRGDTGINPLDEACKMHDITYSKYPNDVAKRHEADKILEEKAWARVNAKNASLAEKAAAWIVTNAIKAKRKLGMGYCKQHSKRKNKKIIGAGLCFSANNSKKKQNKKRKGGKRRKRVRTQGSGINKRNKISFSSIMKKARGAVHKNDSLQNAVKNALFALRQVKAVNRKTIPRTLPLPKTGGAIPIVPILTGLSKIGSIAGSVGAIVAAVKEIIDLKKKIFNGNGIVHRYTLRSVTGSGLYVAPYRRGLGLYVNRKPKN